jgi:hypothetical protein
MTGKLGVDAHAVVAVVPKGANEVLQKLHVMVGLLALHRPKKK